MKLKFGVGFGILIVIVTTVAGLSYYTTYLFSNSADHLVLEANKQNISMDMVASLEMETSAFRAFLSTGKEDDLTRDLDGQPTFKESEDKMEPLLETERGKKAFVAIREKYEEYHAITDQVVRLRREGKSKEALALAFADHTVQVHSELRRNIAELDELIDRLVKKAHEDQDAVEGRTRTFVLLCGVLGTVIGSVTVVLLTRAIVGNITRMVTPIQEIAGNNLAVEDLRVTSEDELGQAATALNSMKNNLAGMIQSIAGTADHVASASAQLSSTSQQITANSEETSTQAQVVSTASGHVNNNLQTVATGSEEMSASIKEIAKNAHESAKVADDTNQIVSKLGDSSIEIGQVVKVITSIAQQTNLLALNATIEAARAGEAGKGFAVVANEVKELAKQTAKATEDISRKIETIQADTKGPVGAIGQISEVIRQVNDISNTIATAVEEQNATTNEMARNLGEAAKGSAEIAQNISGVAEAARNTAHGANESATAANSLAEMSTKLRELVSQFNIAHAHSDHSIASAPEAMSARAGA